MPVVAPNAMLLDMIAATAQTPIPFVAGELAALRIFVADDHALYRQVVARAVDRHPGLALAGEASDGHAALADILATAPDVALLDLRMPDLDGLEICQRLQAIEPDIAVVILTAFDDENTPDRASIAGASACLGKGATEAEICQALLNAGDRPGSCGASAPRREAAGRRASPSRLGGGRAFPGETAGECGVRDAAWL